MAGPRNVFVTPENPRATGTKERRTILFIVLALAVFAVVLYIVLTTDDLTALLLGVLIVVFIYALSRFSGRQSASKGGVAEPPSTLQSSNLPSLPWGQRPCPFCGTWNLAEYSYCQKCGKQIPPMT